MKKYPSFKIDFLGCKITAIFDKNWLDVAHKILKRPLESEQKGFVSNAISIDMDRDYYILAAPNVKDHVVYHECMHILVWIAHVYGFEFGLNTQEFQAYLLEYLIEETLKIKKRKRS